MKNEKTKNIILSAMFIAIGIILPFFTGQIQVIGSMLLPMHIPVLLCGLICGAKYGLIVGAVLPLLRYVLFAMPPLYPVGLAMTFELAAYGFVVGYLYNNSKWSCIISLYRALLSAMVIGRVIWGLSMVVILGMGGSSFTLQAFLAGALLNSVPGIVLQIVLIPVIMLALDKTGLVTFKMKHNNKKVA